MKKLLFHLLLACMVLPGISMAEEDADGGKDHPLFPRMPNYYIYEYDEKEFDTYDFPIGGKDSEKTERVEGSKRYIRYMLKEGGKDAGKVQITRNYANALQKLGGSIMGTPGDESETLKVIQDGREFWACIQPYDGSYDLTIVERKVMKQDITAGKLLEELESKGHVALYINFDTGKDIIKPDSQPIIEQVVQLLTQNLTLALSIEGHTDNTGDEAGNQTLSEMRGRAVMNALISKGIDASRLSSLGYGRTKPIADNNSEEGRAKNRRVEIVKKR